MKAKDLAIKYGNVIENKILSLMQNLPTQTWSIPRCCYLGLWVPMTTSPWAALQDAARWGFCVCAMGYPSAYEGEQAP